MHPFITLDYFFFVLIVGVLAYAFFYQWHRGRKLSYLMEEEASRRSGILEKGVFSFVPRMKFSHDGIEVLLLMTLEGKNTPPYTILKAVLPQGRDWKLRIYRESGLTAVAKAFGRRDIQINNPGFDSAYYIRTNDEMRLRLFLTPVTQSEMISIAQSEPDLSINQGNFELRVPRHFPSPAELKQFIDIGLVLIQKMNELG